MVPSASNHVYADHNLDNRIDPVIGIALIERLESQWRRSSWKSESFGGRRANLDDLTSLEQEPTFCRATVISESLSGRIHAEVESVSGWIHGKDPHLAMIAEYGLGSDLDRWWEIQRPGLHLPKVGSRGHGYIAAENDVCRELVQAVSAAAWFPPNFFGYRLSAGLRSVREHGKPLEIEKQADGTWIINCFDFTIDEDEWDNDVRLRIDYNPNVGGVVTGAIWSGEMYNQPGTIKAWRQMFVTLIDLPGGFCAPARVDIADLLQPTGGWIIYRDVVRNPPAHEDTFRITFPCGIHVTDHVEQKMYVVGTALVPDPPVVPTFLKYHELRDPWLDCDQVS